MLEPYSRSGGFQAAVLTGTLESALVVARDKIFRLFPGHA